MFYKWHVRYFLSLYCINMFSQCVSTFKVSYIFKGILLYTRFEVAQIQSCQNSTVTYIFHIQRSSWSNTLSNNLVIKSLEHKLWFEPFLHFLPKYLLLVCFNQQMGAVHPFTDQNHQTMQENTWFVLIFNEKKGEKRERKTYFQRLRETPKQPV